MRLVDGESKLVDDLLDESEVLLQRTLDGVTVFAMRHPTLGKMVIVRTTDGPGLVVEVDE